MKDCITEWQKIGSDNDYYLKADHYCPSCRTNVNNPKMKVLSETGWETRTVTMKCPCGTISQYVS